MPDISAATLGLVLLTVSIAAIVSRRLGLPYSVGLVLAGILLALLPVGGEVPMTRDLIFTVLLPPLVFEAALQLKWRELRRDLVLIIVLAFVGLAMAALAVAVGLHWLMGWGWVGAGLFGVLIAATDPVSVLAAFKELRVERRLSILVEAESLLNDGTAAVGFSLLLTIAAGGAVTPGAITAALLWTIGGGVAAGLLAAGAMLALARPSRDHLVEITLTTVAAYGSFLLAEHVHASGVLASLTAGLVIGNLGLTRTISPAGRGHVVAFWDYAAFLANSIIFVLIGQQEAHQARHLLTGFTILAVALVLVGRMIAIYPLCFALSGVLPKIGWRYQHVLVWGGLRGALGLALALALPDSVPERGQIIVLAFAVVAFSIFGQGLTMPWMLRRLGLLKDA